MKCTRMITLALAIAAVTGCGESPPGPELPVDGIPDQASGVVSAGIPLHATVLFGREFGDVGSPFPPSHDASFHSYVKMHPRTVVIGAGGVVTFKMASRPPHSLGIYAAGKRPDDIDPAKVDGANLIDDDPADLLFSTSITTSDVDFQFDAPGRYLIICRVVGHFTHANMYGWVIVK